MTRPVSQPAERERLADAFAEGLHKAMCYGPTTLHNRLACERPQVYLSLAEAAVDHPAVRELPDAYADSCKVEYPELARDLRRIDGGAVR